MTNEEFIKNIEEILELKTKLTLDTKLDSLDVWDSLAMLTVITFFNHTLGISPTFQEMRAVKTVSDLITLSKNNDD